MLVGAAIGYRIRNFWAIFIVAIFLHFLLDRLPHWEYHGKIDSQKIHPRELFRLFFRALVDLAGGVFILWTFWKDSPHLAYIAFGAFISILPDGVTFSHLLTRTLLKRENPVLKKFYWLHEKNHIQDSRNYPLWGLAAQSLIVILSIYYFIHGGS
jgi:hypothetical protein